MDSAVFGYGLYISSMTDLAHQIKGRIVLSETYTLPNISSDLVAFKNNKGDIFLLIEGTIRESTTEVVEVLPPTYPTMDAIRELWKYEMQGVLVGWWSFISVLNDDSFFDANIEE